MSKHSVNARRAVAASHAASQKRELAEELGRSRRERAPSEGESSIAAPSPKALEAFTPSGAFTHTPKALEAPGAPGAAPGAAPLAPRSAASCSAEVHADAAEEASPIGLTQYMRLCGTYGCTLPERHRGLHNVTLTSSRARSVKRRWLDGQDDDSHDDDDGPGSARMGSRGKRRSSAQARECDGRYCPKRTYDGEEALITALGAVNSQLVTALGASATSRGPDGAQQPATAEEGLGAVATADRANLYCPSRLARDEAVDVGRGRRGAAAVHVEVGGVWETFWAV